ncbi:MAG: response regulator transcription factor [Anaerolineae bacterium]|nr:response regulator transcription factor [Anaerolineae bacterium]
MSLKVLVVDDENSVSELLVYNLRKAGYASLVAADGRQALDMAQKFKPDLILLDIMLPELDGLDVCRELRKTSAVPIIMLTARDEEVDRVIGLELGADDYICKPFGMRELLARIKAVLRRTHNNDVEERDDDTLSHPAGLRLLITARKVFINNLELNLTRIEFDLLQLLLSHSGRVYTRAQLLEKIWGYDFGGDTRAVDSAIKRLRAKLRHVEPQADCIEAVRGVGYRIKG